MASFVKSTVEGRLGRVLSRCNLEGERSSVAVVSSHNRTNVSNPRTLFSPNIAVSYYVYIVHREHGNMGCFGSCINGWKWPTEVVSARRFFRICGENGTKPTVAAFLYLW